MIGGVHGPGSGSTLRQDMGWVQLPGLPFVSSSMRSWQEAVAGEKEQALSVGKNHPAACQGKEAYSNELLLIKGLIIHYLSIHPKNVSQVVHSLSTAGWLTGQSIEVSLILQPSPSPIVQDSLDIPLLGHRDSPPLED